MEKAIQHGVGQGDSNPDGDYFVKANNNTKKILCTFAYNLSHNLLM